jgi:branched-chain amino acid transport system ATP-binding protein
MLTIARAVIVDPKYLLIDELSLGLAPSIVRRLLPVVRAQVDAGTGVLLVEQFAEAALAFADKVYVISRGRLAYAGAPDRLKTDPALLRDAYLGADSNEGGSSVQDAS